MFAKTLAAAAVLAAAAFSAMPTTAQAAGFGAIAYSPFTGHWGWSRNYESRSTAEHVALLECRVRSSRGCRVAVHFRNACGALAIGPDGWGTGWGVTRARAQSEARGVCGQHSRACTIRMTVCSN